MSPYATVVILITVATLLSNEINTKVISTYLIRQILKHNPVP